MNFFVFAVTVLFASPALSCTAPFGSYRSASCLIEGGEFGFEAIVSQDSVQAAMSAMLALQMSEDDDLPVFAAARILETFEYTNTNSANVQLENDTDSSLTCLLNSEDGSSHTFLDQGTLTDSAFTNCGDVLGSIIAHSHSAQQRAQLKGGYQSALRQAGHLGVSNAAVEAMTNFQIAQSVASEFPVQMATGRFLEAEFLGNNETLMVSPVDISDFEGGGWLKGYQDQTPDFGEIEYGIVFDPATEYVTGLASPMTGIAGITDAYIFEYRPTPSEQSIADLLAVIAGQEDLSASSTTILRNQDGTWKLHDAATQTISIIDNQDLNLQVSTALERYLRSANIPPKYLPTQFQSVWN